MLNSLRGSGDFELVVVGGVEREEGVGRDNVVLLDMRRASRSTWLWMSVSDEEAKQEKRKRGRNLSSYYLRTSLQELYWSTRC
jgi:hypothetical protein